MRTRIDGVHGAIALLDRPAEREAWSEALARLATAATTHGLVAGQATRLLLDGGRLDTPEAERRLAQRLSPGTEAAEAAAWLGRLPRRLRRPAAARRAPAGPDRRVARGAARRHLHQHAAARAPRVRPLRRGRAAPDRRRGRTPDRCAVRAGRRAAERRRRGAGRPRAAGARGHHGPARGGPVSVPAEEPRRRWRLVLGEAADNPADGPLQGRDAELDAALGALYELDEDGGRAGGLGASAPRVARWLGDVRRLFPTSVVRVVQRDAIERAGLRQLLLEPELLETVEPDLELVTTLLALKEVVPAKSRDTARRVVGDLVRELEARLEQRTRQAVRGALDRSARTRRPRPGDIDWPGTIRRNLRHYRPGAGHDRARGPRRLRPPLARPAARGRAAGRPERVDGRERRLRQRVRRRPGVDRHPAHAARRLRHVGGRPHGAPRRPGRGPLRDAARRRHRHRAGAPLRAGPRHPPAGHGARARLGPVRGRRSGRHATAHRRPGGGRRDGGLAARAGRRRRAGLRPRGRGRPRRARRPGLRLHARPLPRPDGRGDRGAGHRRLGRARRAWSPAAPWAERRVSCPHGGRSAGDPQRRARAAGARGAGARRARRPGRRGPAGARGARRGARRRARGCAGRRRRTCSRSVPPPPREPRCGRC